MKVMVNSYADFQSVVTNLIGIPGAIFVSEDPNTAGNSGYIVAFDGTTRVEGNLISSGFPAPTLAQVALDFPASIQTDSMTQTVY